MTKRTKIFHALCAVIIAASAVFGGLRCTESYVRFGLACKSIGLSVGYFFVKLFGIERVIPVDANKLPESIDVSVLPSTTDGFGIRWERFCTTFVTPRNARLYFSDVGVFLLYALIAIAVMIALWLVLRAVLTHTGRKTVTGKYTESKPLQTYKRFRDIVIAPTVVWIRDYGAFVKAHKAYYIPTLIIWVFNLNMPTIVFNAAAFLFYFFASFDMTSVYTNLVRLLYDLKPTVTVVPWWVYIAPGLWLFDVWSKNKALRMLRSMEWENKAFLDSLPVATMLCGTMGKGKTKLLTDMSLSRQAMFRENAREKLIELQMCFPDFPWLRFELELQSARENGEIYNLVTSRRYIRAKKKTWEKHAGNTAEVWYYDGPLDRDNGLYRRELWEVLETYAQLYYIYTSDSSLIVGNYSVRDDSVLMSYGNFPEWDGDFFNRTADDVDESIYCHILDFDALRVGKKVIPDNPNAGSFEFGVVAITEIGKERGNRNDTQGVVKMTDENANRLNDGFNRWLKLCRHSSTVEYFPYISVYMDDQRPESLAADAKELCTLVYMSPNSERKNALPFYGLRSWLYDKLYALLSENYAAHRFMRSDTTLRSHMIHALAAALYRHKTKLDNLYGYTEQELKLENGTQDGEYRTATYYVMNKKILAKRYDTACFADIFARAAVKTTGGVDTYPEYRTVRASLAELKQQNSYFVREMPGTAQNKDKAG